MSKTLEQAAAAFTPGTPEYEKRLKRNERVRVRRKKQRAERRAARLAKQKAKAAKKVVKKVRRPKKAVAVAAPVAPTPKKVTLLLVTGKAITFVNGEELSVNEFEEAADVATFADYVDQFAQALGTTCSIIDLRPSE